MEGTHLKPPSCWVQIASTFFSQDVVIIYTHIPPPLLFATASFTKNLFYLPLRGHDLFLYPKEGFPINSAGEEKTPWRRKIQLRDRRDQKLLDTTPLPPSTFFVCHEIEFRRRSVHLSLLSGANYREEFAGTKLPWRRALEAEEIKVQSCLEIGKR